MVYCDSEQQEFDEHEFVDTDRWRVHVIAPDGEDTAETGHRLDGYAVKGLCVQRDADGWWQLCPGAHPVVKVEGFAPPAPPGPDGPDSSL